VSTVAVVAGLAESLLNFRGPLLRAMVARGHRVVAFAPDAPGIAARLAELGVEFQPVALQRTGLDPFADGSLLWELVARFRALRPGCVFCYTIKPVVYGTVAAALAGVPRRAAMITGLGYAFLGTGLKRRLVRGIAIALYRLALRRAHVVFFQNEDDRELFAALRITSSRNRVELVNGSGVDVAAFAPEPLPDRPAFLMIARLVADKGVREYIAAAKRLRATHPDVPCRLVGMLDPNPAGIRAEELREWTESGDVEFLGELRDVRPALQAASVYVLPSYREGTPRTVLEAMAMGRAIVTTDAPGCRQTVVDGESGLLVPVRDVDGLVAAMARFVADPGLAARFGDAARRRAEERYDVARVNDALLGAMNL
jgi:glycosyltransferase involved in cell wall biosynthesis